MKYKAAIFDMDGTILDTLGDLTTSLNHVFKENGYRHDFLKEDTADFFGSGALVAMERALTTCGHADPVREAARIQPIFAAYYAQHCNEQTGPFEGIPEMLGELKQQGIRLAVISNKADAQVRDLCDRLFPGLFEASYGIKEGIARKPAPDMTVQVLSSFDVPSEDAVYIGDSEVDYETARNAGLDVICVDWGFRKRALLEALSPEYLVSSPAEIGSIILGDS